MTTKNTQQRTDTWHYYDKFRGANSIRRIRRL